MPSILIDSPRPDQDSTASVSGTDTDGAAFDEEAVVIAVLIPTADVAAWQALYTESDAASPSETDSRTIVRAVLDALAVATA